MRLVIGLLLFCAGLSAFPLTICKGHIPDNYPFAKTVDGISYEQCLLGQNDLSLLYGIDFSSPVSAYSMTINMQYLPTGLTAGDITVHPLYGQVTQVVTAPFSGAVVFTLSGTLDPATYGLSAMSFFDLEIDARVGPAGNSQGPIPLPGITFTSLTDPPADAPEPASAVLTGLGLFALAPARRWWGRRSKPA